MGYGATLGNEDWQQTSAHHLILLLLAALGSYAQPVAEPPKYEVASIKPSADDDLDYGFRIEPDGTLAAAGITLRRLMMTAYNVQGFGIVGGPAWVASRSWDVEAKPDRAARPDQIRQMLRTLLEQRFQLRSRSEKRPLAIYELFVDHKGSKLQVTKDAESEPTVRATNGSIQLTNATSATFASQLSYALGRPVIDKTGLPRNFDFALTWTPEPGENGGPTTVGLAPGTSEQPPSTMDGPSIFTAIREQLGLVLKSGRGPVEVVVVDGVQMPTAN
jgi:uncharacterized protein (TIGR03435 family)